MDASAAVLSCRDLAYRADDGKVLVSGACLSLRAGEVLALAGPNGAGKTTLLRLLAGLLPPSAGTVAFFGLPAAALSAADRARRVAFVGQLEAPDHRLSVAEYVALGRIPHQRCATPLDHRRAVADALAAVGLRDMHAAALGRLSGGERQRAAIARALCQEPEILFLDEPTNHLDPKAKGELLTLVAGLGVTTVCVLHDLTLIPGLASHTALLDNARVIAAGPTAETLTREAVKTVFGVDYLKLDHPEKARTVPALDLSIT